MKIIKNILLSSKIINRLFTIKFKEEFSIIFGINLLLYQKGGFWKNIIYSSILQEVSKSFENIEYHNINLRLFFKYINCKQYFLNSKSKIKKNNDEETDKETDSDDEIECLCEKKVARQKVKKQNDNESRIYYTCSK